MLAIVHWLFAASLPFALPIDERAEAAWELHEEYIYWCEEPSDINQHLPRLRKLARECGTVTEIGLRTMVSSWGLLQGLAESQAAHRSYLGIDVAKPPAHCLNLASRLATSNGIAFQFWHENDIHVQIPTTDLLFIDSLHTYCHLFYELEKFSPYVTKYIALHDTSETWATLDDSDYKGDYREYPVRIDRNKRGLWAAVEDFLAQHPEWRLREHHFNNHGFTVLERILYPVQ